jgi:putative redox protein
MADTVVLLHWQNRGMEFVAGREGGPTVIIDGNGKAGPSPMVTFLIGLAGCTASDILEIAGKMRVTFGGFEVRAEGDRWPEPPRRYTKIRLVYRVAGVNEGDREKIRRAVQLSQEKYCSAIHSIRQDIELTSDVEFE